MLGITYEGGRVSYDLTGRRRLTAEELRTKIIYPELMADPASTKIIPTITAAEVVDVVGVEAPNGDKLTVGVDANGDVVAVEKQPDWLPLALAAGAAFLFLG